MKEPKLHILKTDPGVFQKVMDGLKYWEIRFNDRDYQEGDTLTLRETRYTGEEMKNKPMHNEVIPGKPLEYTGREIDATVMFVLRGPVYGLQDGWCIMSIEVTDSGVVDGSGGLV